jgi:tRNA1(Val) A37 N6-methylase TrmN6
VLTTAGGLLNGRLRYHQPEKGFRSGIEPVFLAASVPARAGDRVLEAGTGAGAALLCLHARVAGLDSLGIELDPEMAALAGTNAAANGFDGMQVLNADVLTADLPDGFHHAIANPPYHPVGSLSPLPAREIAKRGDAVLIRGWIRRMAALLRPRGTLTLILPAGVLPACLSAMTEAGCDCSALYPLWPRAACDAKLMLARGVKGSRAPLRVAAGMILHHSDGTYTAAAQTVLREGQALKL